MVDIDGLRAYISLQRKILIYLQMLFYALCLCAFIGIYLLIENIETDTEIIYKIEAGIFTFICGFLLKEYISRWEKIKKVAELYKMRNRLIINLLSHLSVQNNNCIDEIGKIDEKILKILS